MADPVDSSPFGDATEHFLQKVALFSSLTTVDCEQVEKRLKRQEFPPQAVIVREGNAGDSMFIILDGLVAVRRRDPETGIDFELAQLGPGQAFGEMALLTGRPRSATCVALQPTTCAVFAQRDLEALMLHRPKLALALTATLADRLDHANQRVGVDFLNLSKAKVDPRVIQLLPLAVMKQHQVIPVSFANNRLLLAMTNPSNVLAFDDVRRVLKGILIEPVAISEEDYRKFMAATVQPLFEPKEPPPSVKGRTSQDAAASAATPGQTTAATIDLMSSDMIRDLQMLEDSQAAAVSATDLMTASSEAPIVKLANSALALAIQQRASDIHIEPMEQEVILRFRVDGALQVVQKFPKKVQLGLISRVKILSKLDIAEKRMPQDGRISVTMEGKAIDFRVSTVPGKWGEKVCMRILDRSSTRMGLDKLITDAPTLATFRDLIAEPHGIVYVTGPTGSGKTTTLYAALGEINDPDINISTVEDPIEYDLPGVTQIQVNADIGLDFARVLRAFLRQDPDVLLVGETRDKETARIAVEAALTGHLVFTTLHTNSAAASFIRLADMGIEPFLVSTSTLGIVAQRLARRLCDQCKEAYVAEDSACDFLGIPKGATLYKGKGCSACGNRGVKGRVGIYEVMKMNPELRTMVAKGAMTEDVHACAVRHGMTDLKRYAVQMLLNGATSLEEVMQVVSMRE
jgi:type IV pilus assembly protein PilB